MTMIILIDQIKAQLSKMVSIDKRSRLAFSGSSPFILRLTVFEIGSPTCNTQPSSSLSPSSKGWSFPHDDDDDDFDGVQPCWLLCRCNLRGPEGRPSKGPGTRCAKPLSWGEWSSSWRRWWWWRLWYETYTRTIYRPPSPSSYSSSS